MRTLVLYLLVFSLFLSGCSPDSGFYASESLRVTPTAPEITPENTVVINPRPNKQYPKPAPTHLGYLQVAEGVLSRTEDNSLLFKAKLIMKDRANNTVWERQIELDGQININSRANLYPINGDVSGEAKVRARLTCLDYSTCNQAIIDVFLDDSQKVHGTQVEVEMDSKSKRADQEDTLDENPISEEAEEAPAVLKTPQQSKNSNQKQVRPTKGSPKNIQRVPSRPQTPQLNSKPAIPTLPAEPIQKQKPTATPTQSKTQAPIQKSAPAKTEEKPEGNRFTRWIKNIWSGDNKDTRSQQEQADQSSVPTVGTEAPGQLAAPTKNQDVAPNVIPKPQSAPVQLKPSSLPIADESSVKLPGFLNRLFGRIKTDTVPKVVHEVPAPANNQRPLKRASRPVQQNDVKPNVVSTASAALQQSQASADTLPKVATSSQNTKPTNKTQSTPALPVPVTQNKASVAQPASESEEDEELDHGNDGEDEEDDHEHEEEEKPSLYIGTLHEPTEDLFKTDRPPAPKVGNERPLPRPDRPEAPSTPDELEQANKGDRPRDQVIGRTGCQKNQKGPSCGFLERASNLTPLAASGNFKMVNTERQRFYGSHELVTVINYLGAYFRRNPSFGPLTVNDLSQKQGGKLKNSDHKSHQNGLDADIAFPYDTRVTRAFARYVSGGQATPGFKAAETWKVFKTLWKTQYVDRIFVNEAIKEALCIEADRVGEKNSYAQLLRRIRPEAGHDKHFHLRIECSYEHPRCRRMGEPPLGTGC